MGVSLVLASALLAPTLINEALSSSIFNARALVKVVLLLFDNIIASLLSCCLSAVYYWDVYYLITIVTALLNRYGVTRPRCTQYTICGRSPCSDSKIP